MKDPVLGDEKNQIYANVQYIESHPDLGKIILRGHNPSSCYTLDKVRVIDNNKKTISILPRMEKIRSHCPRKMIPFEIEVDLKMKDFEPGSLIHVRSMYGNSINTIF